MKTTEWNFDINFLLNIKCVNDDQIFKGQMFKGQSSKYSGLSFCHVLQHNRPQVLFLTFFFC